jgi:hypothetical protein
MSRNRHHRIFPALLVLRENGLAILVVLALLLFTGWQVAQRWDRRMAQCLRAYDRVHTAADSATVDRTPVSGRSRTTCLDLRRDGTLERYRRSVEAGRVPRRG